MPQQKFKKSWAALIVFIAVLTLMNPGVPAQQVLAWKPNTPYKVGELVTYNGNTYSCRQAHTSLVGWEPPIVLALWLPVPGGGTSGGGSGVSDTQAPTAPMNLRVTGSTTSNVALAWSASSDNVAVTAYDISRNGMSVGVSTTNSFTATGLQAGTSYTFSVRAKDAAGNLSVMSAQVSAMTQSGAVADTQAPTAPMNLRVTGSTTSNVALAWNASSDNTGVTGYDVLRNGMPVGMSTTNSFTATGLQAGTSYTFSVRAKDAANNQSTASAQVTATTQSAQSGGGTSDGGGNTGGGNTQLPKRVMVGYWHNFDNGSGFIKLRDVDPNWDIVQISFGESARGSYSTIELIPDLRTSAAEIKADVAVLKSRGKKVLLSIGGANAHVELPTENDRQNFINSVSNIITQYGLDGIDIDLEGSSLSLNGGDTDFRNPTTPKVVNLISAIRTIANRFGQNFILTMAPETFFVQVGYQTYGGSAGAYLPLIHALRDKLTILHVQHYNTGSITALDGKAYNSATADFQVAMAEMLMTGFPVGNNPNMFFPGLREDQVAIGLPASTQAAGSGYTPPAEIKKALDCLIQGKPTGGNYVLRRSTAYPNFRGVMSWSVNWDRFTNFVFSKSVRSALSNLP